MEEIIIDIKELEEITISDDSEVIIIGSEPEDLITELTEQDNLLTTQKVSLEDVKRALQGKIGGSGGGSVLPKVEESTLIFATGKAEGGVLSL